MQQLDEFFHMMSFLRPSLLGRQDSFNREFAKPINAGLASNASDLDNCYSLEKSTELFTLAEPYIHRKDMSVLTEHLPPLHQVVITVRQTRMQAKLYRAQKRYQDANSSGDIKSEFLKQYQTLQPINSHPGSLLFSEAKKASENAVEADEWWKPTIEREGEDKVKEINNGYKITLLFHLLAHAQQLGEKVVIFANSLRTLNYIEHVLTLDWMEVVPNLQASFPGMKCGSWKKSEDFFRIDGTVNANKRGDRIAQFEESPNAKAFLLSKAGGIGINLVSWRYKDLELRVVAFLSDTVAFVDQRNSLCNH
jgi:SNF2 family DNA or RNA helicase